MLKGGKSMEKRMILPPPRKKIALIVPYFGLLPPYFPIWLESAKANPDVDFFFYTDQAVQIDAPNFRVTKITLERLREQFARTLGRPVSLPNGYKLCDYRPAYGVLFAEELRGYDFWGHCDIDMALGRIRHFVTDERMETYDRIYSYGCLSFFRNSEKMNRAFELPGAWYTQEEMFGPVHVGMDEFAGMNRICLNHPQISWYVDIHAAHLRGWKNRLDMANRQTNYETQIFYWRDGRVFQRYVSDGQIMERELVHMHWYRRRPIPERLPAPGEVVVLTADDRLIVRSPEDLTPENMRRWNPPSRKIDRFLDARKGNVKDCLFFLTGSLAQKRIWLKRKRFTFLEMKLKKPPYP